MRVGLPALIVVCLAAGGCGRFYFDQRSDGAAGDGAADASNDTQGSPMDAQVDTSIADGGGQADAQVATCSWSVPFSMSDPLPLEGVNSNAEESELWISSDGLRATLRSDRSGDYTVYETSRASVDEPFDTPVEITGPLAEGFTIALSYSSDELRAYVSGVIPPFSSSDVFVSERTNRADAFPVLARLPFMTDLDEYDAVESPDGLELIYATFVPGTDDDITVATRGSQAEASIPSSMSRSFPKMGARSISAPIAREGWEAGTTISPAICRNKAHFRTPGTILTHPTKSGC